MKVDATVEINETVVEVPGNVLFVFDQSQSMGESWEGKPKWQAANDAVVGAFTPLQDKLNAGVVLFPAATTTTPDKTCDFLKDPFGCLAGSSSGGLCPEVAPIASSPQLPIQTGKAYLQAWNTYWTKGAKALAQGTPTEKALLEAEKALASPPPGNTAVVLVTDGQPTCGSNESAIAARLRQKNIKTYVVGLPGSAGTRVLDQVAIAGDTAPAGCTSKCFLSPADPTELQSALASIATKTVSTTTVKRLESCSFQLAAPKDADPSNVHMVATKAADGQQYEVPRDGNGWTLSADNRTATLGDDLCNKAKAGAFTGLSFQYGCVAVPIIIL